MQIDKQTMVEFAEIVAKAVVQAISQNGNSKVVQPKQEKSAYQKTEQLLYNYPGFKRIIKERELEIEEIRKYGVPQKCGGVTEFVQKGGLPHGLVLEEESVEAAVQRIERSVQGTVDAIALIDKCMSALKNDPYYKVLEMRYFDGRTQEDIAFEFGCSQVTISNNKNRLVRELSMRLFPNQVIQEFMS
jgi:RNA polymerase sigma factor (sigma-70 family)